MSISYDQVRFPVRKIKDPIHDYIDIDPFMAVIIDSEHFQRLRNIKQLGTTCFVWPSASHSRFEHCLGVAHLARQMATQLQTSQPSLNITDRDIMCVTLAGLCHDLGHGPWSHVFDGLFIPRALPGREWHHEDGSELMFDDMVATTGIGLALEDQCFIKALIAGDPKNPTEKAFLFDIVANKRNGLDVDKFDYIQRDFRMIGDQNSISIIRLVHTARVLDNQICYHIKDVDYIYELCQTRFKLHKLYYNHKAAKAIEYMIIDALLAAEPHLKIAEKVFDPQQFLHLTDVIMPMIEMSSDPALEPAKAIFQRIRRRKLYRLIEGKVVDWSFRDFFRQRVSPESIVNWARRISRNNGPLFPASELEINADDEDSEETEIMEISPSRSSDGGPIEVPDVEDIIVDFSTMHYGMKEKNPLDFVKFYGKQQPNIARKAVHGVYSGLKPQFFAEDLLRIYSKRPHLDWIIQLAWRHILVAMRKGIIDEVPIEAEEDWSETLPGTTTSTTTQTLLLSDDAPCHQQSANIGVPTPPTTEPDLERPEPSTPKPKPTPLPLRSHGSHGRSTSLNFIPGAPGSAGYPSAVAVATSVFTPNAFQTIGRSPAGTGGLGGFTGRDLKRKRTGRDDREYEGGDGHPGEGARELAVLPSVHEEENVPPGSRSRSGASSESMLSSLPVASATTARVFKRHRTEGALNMGGSKAKSKGA